MCVGGGRVEEVVRTTVDEVQQVPPWLESHDNWMALMEGLQVPLLPRSSSLPFPLPFPPETNGVVQYKLRCVRQRRGGPGLLRQPVTASEQVPGARYPRV